MNVEVERYKTHIRDLDAALIERKQLIAELRRQLQTATSPVVLELVTTLQDVQRQLQAGATMLGPLSEGYHTLLLAAEYVDGTLKKLVTQ